MARSRIVIIGSNVAGFTAAIALKGLLRARHDVTVISRVDQFVFHPSLVRIPLGARTAQQAVFAVRSPLAEAGVAFRDEPALKLDLARRRVITPTTEERYDFLIIATGAKPNYAAVPGLGPRGYTHSVMTLPEADRARTAFEQLLEAPGPVVIGDVQGSSARKPAWEFLLNIARVLEQRGLSHRAPLTYLTSGPGFVHATVNAITHAAITEIIPNEIRLTDGRRLPFAYAMLIPAFLGVDVVRACEKITDASGFVKVNEFGQNPTHPEIFAAGAAAAEPVEKSGYHAEQMAQRVARNIAACILAQPMIASPPPPIDVRGSSVAAQLLSGSDGGWLTCGPEAAWDQLAFERYFPVQVQSAHP